MPDPTDPVKKVTRGKTKTTTSTRRGEIRPGIPGTFTDTTSNTPVTTETTNPKGSKRFNAAFAEATSKNLSEFDFDGKPYTTEKGNSSTSNESSMTSTFKADKVQGVPQLNPSGIKFSPQSYKMGKTQDIQRPGEDAMHVMKVGRNSPKGGTRDYHLVTPRGDGPGYFQGKQAITQDYRTMTLKQKEGLVKNVDLHNKLLNDKYSPENITKTIQSRQDPTTDPRVLKRREQHLQAQIAKGQTLIEGNKAWYKTPE